MGLFDGMLYVGLSDILYMTWAPNDIINDFNNDIKGYNKACVKPEFIEGLITNKYYLQEHTNYQLIITGIVCKCRSIIRPIFIHLKLAIALNCKEF